MSAMADYIAQVLPAAQKQSKRTGIPVSVFLAQSGNETGWGTSQWWRQHLNPAGIGVTGASGAGFSFPSVDAAFQAYADKLLGHGEAGQGQFVADVNRGADPMTLLRDIEASPWAASHYGGHGLENIWTSNQLGKYDLPGAKPPPGGNPMPPGGVGISTASFHIPGTGVNVPTPGDAAKAAAGTVAGPVIDFVQSVAVRTGLVLFGAVAILLGLAILFHSEEHAAEAHEAGAEEGEAIRSEVRQEAPAQRAAPAPVAVSSSSGSRGRAPGEAGAGRAVSSDVKETATGAAEAV